MTRNHLTYAVVTLWAALFALSFVLAFSLEPTGDGFTRGLNRISAFLVWQGIAVAVAVVAWLTGRGVEGSGTRWLSRIPAIVHLLMVLLVIGLVLAVRFTQPPIEPELPPGPATAPAAVGTVPTEQQTEFRQYFVIGNGPAIDSNRLSTATNLQQVFNAPETDAVCRAAESSYKRPLCRQRPTGRTDSNRRRNPSSLL
jgi:hypothetical protein